MSSDSREHTELIALIETVLNDRATTRDVTRLDELLAESEAARSVYLDYVEIHAGLVRKYAAPDHEDEALVEPVDPPEGRSSRLRAAAVGFAIAASLLVAVVFQQGGDGAPQTDASLAAEQRASLEGLAVVSRMIDVQWRLGSSTFAEGDVVPAGELALDGGLVQLDFYNGAVAVLTGPARLSLLSRNEARLEAGRLRARVPQSAVGFAVDTPLGKVVDLGTEFAVGVTERGRTGELHVLEGKVEFTPEKASAGGPVVLEAGEGLAMTSKGITEVAETELADRFIGPTQFESLARGRRTERYQDWVQWRETLLADPALIACYGHSPEAAWARTMRNFAPNAADDSHGVVIGADWAPGRWPGHKAIAFRKASQRVSINVPDVCDSMTLSAWVSLDRLLEGSKVKLIDSQRDSLSGLYWTLESASEGAVSHFAESLTKPKQAPSWRHYNSRIWAFRPGDYGNWIHLAVTYNADSKRVTHYRNGEIIHAIAIDSPRPISIGAADLGNSTLSEWSGKKPLPPSHLLGNLDEFVVLGRALTTKEVRQMYDVGAP